MGNSKSLPVQEGNLEISLANFKLQRVVGKGSYGKVRVVELKSSDSKIKEQYALKYIRKIDCVRADFAHNIIRERRILQELEHPLIVNLRYAFQDEEFMYMVSDLMLGGDLRFQINRKTFTEEAVRFWIVEIACALRYLHSRGIVHRDVKPDNILLDGDGHAHLADFNVASYLQPHRKLTGKSGTAAYMAPEVYSGVGYDTSPDYFSLGVTFYECIYSRLPFEAEKGDTLGRQIQFTDPPFPQTSPPVNNLCILAIRDLLERDPSRRIGAMSWSSLTDHPFFAPLDFEMMEQKLCEPVFQPSQDKSNFDAVYELEELLLEQAPLEGRARKAAKKQQQLQARAASPAKEGTEIRRSKKELPRRKGKTDDEGHEEEIMQMINQYFEPYDYTRYAGNPQKLESLANGIRRLSVNDGVITPAETPPPGSCVPDRMGSRTSTGHDSTSSVPPLPPLPSTYRSDSTPESEHGYPLRYPTPPTPPSVYPGIRPPPAVARLAGKEKKKNVMGTPPAPTSHPVQHQTKEAKGRTWGKKDKDTKSESKWESGVIGRERARVIIDGSGKR